MVTRIGGLASGMDIDSIVEKLMQAEKAPLNKLQQQKQTYEWQRDAYRDVNKQLKAFDTFLFDNMQLQSSLLKKKVSSTNEAVSATSINAKDGAAITIDSVEKLATATRRVATVQEGTTKATTMSSLGLMADSNVSMSVMQNDGTFKDININIKSSDTISDVVSKLSDNTGMTAFYDEGSRKISLTVNATGKGKVIDGSSDKTSSIFVVSDGNGILSKLGFGTKRDLSNDDSTKNSLNQDGENAIVTVNGLQIERSSNTFDINGFSITLNDKYTGSKPITLSASVDADNMVDKIKKFVETYNGLVESLNNTVKETKNRDYTPLTDEQKEEMEKEEIEKWESKAKSGILRSDSILRNGLSELRSMMYEKGGSSNPLLDTLSDLGITTTKSYLDGGKLEINEEKLRTAISKDSQAVADVFTKSLNKGEVGEEGIVQKLRTSLSKTMSNIEKKAGKTTSTESNYTIGKSLLNIGDRIDTWKSKLETIEERYWKQFTSMETAINKANQQSSLFTTTQ